MGVRSYEGTSEIHSAGRRLITTMGKHYALSALDTIFDQKFPFPSSSIRLLDIWYLCGFLSRFHDLPAGHGVKATKLQALVDDTSARDRIEIPNGSPMVSSFDKTSAFQDLP